MKPGGGGTGGQDQADGGPETPHSPVEDPRLT
jgi:hypothetical protein